ncbi:MAG: alpha/beta hydrolase [Candidatus Bipolaricaulota bacterium]|nr:alpha/beta hydrolase [Candidatus Bipolaricaulota bacterium]
MPTVKVHQTELYFARAGQGQPALLFVHGAGGDHTLWGQQLRDLAQNFTVAALDLNGHGRSPARAGDGVQTYVADVLAVLEALAAPTVLVGHSMGGAIALTVALQRPKNLIGLGLVGTGAKLKVHPQILELCQTDFERAVELVISWAFAEHADPALKDKARDSMHRNGQAALSRDFLSCSTFDVMNRLSEISVPTIVICGREDKLTPVKYSEYLQQNIPSAQLKILERAGHMAMLEQPTAIAQALQEFCEQLL